MQRDRSAHWAIAVVLGATLGFSFKGILARFAYGAGVNVAGLLLLRAAFATPLLWACSLIFRKQFSGIARTDFAKATASGALFLLSASMDFSAIERLGAGPSRVILFVYPLFVLLLEAVRLHKPPARRQIAAFAIAWAGLLIVSGDGWRRGADSSGVLFALAGAASHATYLTITQGLARRMGSLPFTVASNTGTAVGILIVVFALLPAGSARVTAEGAAWLGLLALLCTALPMLLMVEGIRLMGAGPSSLLSLLGPVITLLAAAVLLSEPLTPAKILGSGLVIGAVGWLASERMRPRADPQRKRPPAEVQPVTDRAKAPATSPA